MQPKLRIVSLAALALVAGCSSTNPYVEHRLTLEHSLQELDHGQYARTTRELEKLLAQTDATELDFSLQRFFAAYLLTRAHESASSNAPFLLEPARRRGGFGMRKPGGGGETPSRLGHMMAMTYHSSFGLTCYDGAEASPHEFEQEQLLPDQLEQFGTENALLYMNLCFLAVHSELNFQDRIEEILLVMEDLTDLETCEEAMQTVQLEAALRPWIYRAVFEHQKRRNEPNAYRFGIRARETAKGFESFPPELASEIAQWITDESSYRFVSPANQPFDPALEGCTVTGTPNLMYEATLRNP